MCVYVYKHVDMCEYSGEGIVCTTVCVGAPKLVDVQVESVFKCVQANMWAVVGSNVCIAQMCASEGVS